MVETALEDLLDIMRDPASGLRNRLNAAIAASRIVKVVMPGEPLPECIQFLDEIIGTEYGGSRFKVEYRREAATAKGWYEKRVNAAVLKLGEPGDAEKRELWRRHFNGGIRIALARLELWPERKDLLLSPDDETFETPELDPQLVTAAVMGGSNRHTPRRIAGEDEGPPRWTGTEAERLAVIRIVANFAAERIATVIDKDATE